MGKKLKLSLLGLGRGLLVLGGFLFYRQDNVNGLIALLIAVIGSNFIAGFIVLIVIGMYAKYYVIKRFEKALDNNEIESKAGVSKCALYVAIIVSAMIFSGAVRV